MITRNMMSTNPVADDGGEDWLDRTTSMVAVRVIPQLAVMV